MIQNQSTWARSLTVLLPLVLTVSAFTGCQRVDTTPDRDVVLQAQGHFSGEDHEVAATMILRANPVGLELEIVSKDSGRSLVQALVATDKQVLNRKEWFRGPLVLDWRQSGFDVIQAGDLSFQVLEVQGTKAYQVSRGELAFHGSRRLRYSAGHLDRDVRAQLRLKLFHKDGSPAGSFEGVSNFPTNPALTGTEMVVPLTGSTSLGSGSDAKLTISMLRGTGSIDYANKRHPFNFDKKVDLTPPGGAGEMVQVAADEYHVEVKDQFSAKVKVPSINLTLEKTLSNEQVNGTGEVNVSFDIHLEIDSDKVIVSGKSSMSGAFYTPADGNHGIEFSGNKPVALELEW